jgi:hypothetical protein
MVFMKPGVLSNVSARIFHRSIGLTLAAVGPVYVYIHRSTFAPENVEIMKRHESVFAHERKRPFPILSILEVTGSYIVPLSKEARDAAVELTRATASHVSCCAVVFDREGFMASVIRSIVTTLQLLARPGYPLRVFATMPAALAWIESRLDEPSRAEFDATAIAKAVEALRVEAGQAKTTA